MDIIYFINEIGLQIIILIVALLSFSRLDKFTKVLCLQVAISVLFYLATKVFDRQYNPFIYNFYIPLESLTLLYAAATLVHLKFEKNLLYVFYAGVLLACVAQIIFSNIFDFFNYAYCIGSLFITITYLYLLFLKISETNKMQNFKTFLFASLGIIIYFACNTPYMGLMNYLLVEDSELSSILFDFITRVLSNVRYLLLLIGIALMVRNNKAQQVKTI